MNVQIILLDWINVLWKHFTGQPSPSPKPPSRLCFTTMLGLRFRIPLETWKSVFFCLFSVIGNLRWSFQGVPAAACLNTNLQNFCSTKSPGLLHSLYRVNLLRRKVMALWHVRTQLWILRCSRLICLSLLLHFFQQKHLHIWRLLAGVSEAQHNRFRQSCRLRCLRS